MLSVPSLIPYQGGMGGMGMMNPMMMVSSTAADDTLAYLVPASVTFDHPLA